MALNLSPGSGEPSQVRCSSRGSASEDVEAGSGRARDTARNLTSFQWKLLLIIFVDNVLYHSVVQS